MISVLSQEGHAKVGVYEYVIDTVAELSDVPTDVHAGSMVYCIENSKKYMLNNAGTYVEVNFKKGGSGGEAKLGSKDISENGTYRASEFDLDGWSQVNVDVENTYHLTDEGKVVQNGELVSQTSTTKTANGTYDTTANNQVVINVPIPSGYIQPTGTSNITSNGIYDITSFASVDVNVSGGGGDGGVIDDSVESYYNANISRVRPYAFYGIGNLRSVDLPNVTSIGSSAFASAFGTGTYCRIRRISIGSNTTSGTVMGSWAFTGNEALEVIEIPNLTNIAPAAFNGCTNLRAAIFPLVGAVSSTAFSGCTKLSYARFDNGAHIRSSAFTKCKSLMTFINLGSWSTPRALDNVNAFANTPMSNSTYTGSFGSIYVPASLVASYKVAANWSAYADRITSYIE